MADFLTIAYLTIGYLTLAYLTTTYLTTAMGDYRTIADHLHMLELREHVPDAYVTHAYVTHQCGLATGRVV